MAALDLLLSHSKTIVASETAWGSIPRLTKSSPLKWTEFKFELLSPFQWTFAMSLGIDPQVDLSESLVGSQIG